MSRILIIPGVMVQNVNNSSHILNCSFNNQLPTTIAQQKENNICRVTTQVPKIRTNAERQRDYRQRKKLLKILSEETALQTKKPKMDTNKTTKKKCPKFRTNAEKQKAYRERKKLKLKALLKKRSENVQTKEGKNENSLINQLPVTNSEKISSEMSVPGENNILACEIKTEPRVNEEIKKEAFFQENRPAEIYFQTDGIKQEVTEDVNDAEESFYQGNSFPADRTNQELSQDVSEESIFNYNSTHHFQLSTNQVIFQEPRTNYKPMTNAEKQKAYRERKKLRLKPFSKQNNNKINNRNENTSKRIKHEECNISNFHLINQNVFTEKSTVTENTVQTNKTEEEISDSVNEANISNLELTNEFASTGFQEVCPENLLSQKSDCNEKFFSFVDVSTILIKDLNNEGRRSSSKRRSNAERQKAYRERKKLKLQKLSKADVYKNISTQDKDKKDQKIEAM